MPRIKRWFAVSDDINSDPEFRRFRTLFGAAGLSFWLETLAMLERTDNHWDLHKDFDLLCLAQKCGTKPKNILGAYQYLVDLGWLRVGVDSCPFCTSSGDHVEIISRSSPHHPEIISRSCPDHVNMNWFIFAPKWLKYNKSRERKNTTTDNVSAPKSIPTLPIPIPIPNSSPKGEELEKEKGLQKDPKRKSAPAERAPDSDLFNLFWQSYPPRNGKRLNKQEAQRLFIKMSDDDQLLCVSAARHYAESQRTRDGIGIKDPNRFIFSGKGDEPWRDWIDAEVVTVSRTNGSRRTSDKMQRIQESYERVLNTLEDD